MGEVEAQAVGSHEGAGLVDVVTEHLLERSVKEVGRGVVAADELTTTMDRLVERDAIVRTRKVGVLGDVVVEYRGSLVLVGGRPTLERHRAVGARRLHDLLGVAHEGGTKGRASVELGLAPSGDEVGGREGRELARGPLMADGTLRSFGELARETGGERIGGDVHA